MTMASKHNRSSTRRTTNPVGINIRARDARAATHADRVLLAGSGLVGVVPAAGARAEEEIVVPRRSAQVNERTFLGVVGGGVVCDVGAGS